MAQDSSFVGAFDLSSQAGVMSVLASIRASALSPADKNELRDLVFLYTNGGGDASVRIALEQKLNAHAIVPVVMEKRGVAAPVLPFGSYRPTPTFKAPVVPPVSVSAPTSPVVAPVLSATTGVLTPVPPTSISPPVVEAPAIPPTPVPPPAPTPVPITPQPVSAPVVPPAAPTPVAVPVPPAAPVATPQAAGIPQTEAGYLERIRQIKTAVNSQVGNPVNLVDINNAVGREYMNALLEAMKKLGSGAVSEMGAAMARLEAAYAQVELALQARGTSPAPAQSPVTPPLDTPQPVTAPIATAPAPIPVPPPPQPVSAPVVPPTPQVDPVQEPPRVRETPPLPRSNTSEELEVEEVSSPEVLREDPRLQRVASLDEGSGYETPVAVPETPVVAPLRSLADTQFVKTPADLPQEPAVESGDPLLTKEVDDGLEQLLADWSLFKKSGLFGTGPKGRQHPLFKKIAELQVPLLLAGRFEGATQEIRQSITDYMNGWRYEQGIIYEQGETFERYLRRVIRHILDLQKKRKHG